MNVRLILAVLAIFVSASSAHAVGVFSKVEGKVTFVQRKTIVPFFHAEDGDSSFVCGSRICPESQTYWAMVILDGDTAYEVDHAFNPGAKRAPESIEIGGMKISEGTQVAVDAQVDEISPNFGVIEAIRDLSIVH